jgi:hypothetical protein
VDLPRRKILEQANKEIEYVYFPEHGAASVVAKKASAPLEVEIGLIGHEGMTGWPVVIGNDRSPYESFMQIEGNGHQLAASMLRQLMKQRPTLQQLLLN